MNDSAKTTTTNGVNKMQHDTTTTTPDLTTYDRIIINSSAGKDSQAMLDHVYRLANQAGVLDALIVVHADLGRVEWKGTAKLAKRQAEIYGLRFEKISRPQGDLLDHVEARGMWPSSTARYCTSDHKRDQIAKIITKITHEVKATGVQNVRVLNCLGLRADESPARAKRESYLANKRLCNNTRTVHEWLPIHDWTQEKVWARIHESGVPYHTAYDKGMPRLSCVFCIFAPKAALEIAGRHNPELLDEYVRIEKKIGHTFKADMAIAEIKDAIENGTTTNADLHAAWNM